MGSASERRKSRLSRRASTLMTTAALLLLAGCGGAPGMQGHADNSPAANTSPGSVSPPHRYVSFTSYPGWIQSQIPPAKFDFTPWTVINDFGLWPTKTGGIAVGDMQSLSYIPPAVTAAHRAGKMIIMAVGEQGLGPAFAGGASPQNRAKLISNIVSYVSRYHFDGVDIDWEEEVPQNEADYMALIRDLRTALDSAFPGRHMFLSADVDVGQIPPYIAVQIAPYVNTLNLETFQDSGVSSVTAYSRAGIPVSKMLLGIGVANGYYDINEARVAAKVKYVETHGLAGTLLWQPGNLRSYRTDPRLVPLRQMVGISG